MYVSDLGLNRIYVLRVRSGKVGTIDIPDVEPAGIVVDDEGVLLVADAKNSQLKVVYNL